MMAFGNMGDDCGTGVAFTRDPATGENGLFGEFLTNAQGEDVVAGVRTPMHISEMEQKFPEAFAQFKEVCNTLEKHYRDMQDVYKRQHLTSDQVNVIEILPGGVVTKKTTARIQLDENGEFVRNPEEDLVKVAVVERHQGTGNVACGFLKGYGIKEGAVALSVAHDSHNIIVVGVSDEEMEFAVNSLIEQEGGIVLVKDGKVIEQMPMPIAGLMSCLLYTSGYDKIYHRNDQ